MIVIVTEQECEYFVQTGDVFTMQIEGRTIVEETFCKPCIINFVCSFLFAKENGECVRSQVAGFFGNTEDLPKEIREARRLRDLTPDQLYNFVRTCGLTATIS